MMPEGAGKLADMEEVVGEPGGKEIAGGQAPRGGVVTPLIPRRILQGCEPLDRTPTLRKEIVEGGGQRATVEVEIGDTSPRVQSRPWLVRMMQCQVKAETEVLTLLVRQMPKDLDDRPSIRVGTSMRQRFVESVDDPPYRLSVRCESLDACGKVNSHRCIWDVRRYR